MAQRKLAVIFPGIGYNKDKPLLYYSGKLAVSLGYELLHIEYRDMPAKIKGDPVMMRKAAEIAVTQSEEQLSDIDFGGYDDVIFIGKSIGTVALAKYAADHSVKAGQIWYTPVEATFSWDGGDAIAFIGDADPWSDVNEDKRLAKELNIPLYSYPYCNHSLECDDVDKNIEIMRDVMDKTGEFLRDRR